MSQTVEVVILTSKSMGSTLLNVFSRPYIRDASRGTVFLKTVFPELAPPTLQLCVITFTALHGMQTRSSDENSVRLSVTRVNCDKTVERSVQIYIPYA